MTAQESFDWIMSKMSAKLWNEKVFAADEVHKELGSIYKEGSENVFPVSRFSTDEIQFDMRLCTQYEPLLVEHERLFRNLPLLQDALVKSACIVNVSGAGKTSSLMTGATKQNMIIMDPTPESTDKCFQQCVSEVKNILNFEIDHNNSSSFEEYNKMNSKVQSVTRRCTIEIMARILHFVKLKSIHEQLTPKMFRDCQLSCAHAQEDIEAVYPY